jgi:hypothetical protein
MKTLLATLCAIGASSAAFAAPVQWSAADGGNDHYYEFVTAPTDWDSANAAAQASTYNDMTGYLVTITSAEEKNFVNDTLLSGANTWLGAERVDGTNSFVWATGPEAGDVFYDNGVLGTEYSSFWGGEPNGQFGGENKVEMWGNNWNDMSGSGSRAYVIEYSSMPATVPLPASSLLLGAGLGALLMGRRRRAA